MRSSIYRWLRGKSLDLGPWVDGRGVFGFVYSFSRVKLYGLGLELASFMYSTISLVWV